MWQERCQAICGETARTRAPVHVGNLVELLQVGRSIYNNQGVADFLRPSIVRGDLLAIAECTPEQLALIERESPSLIEAFARLDVPEPQPDQCRSILAEAARAWAGKIVVGSGCLETLDRLHRRYATYSSFPGRPLRFLKNLLHDLPACGAAVPAARAGGPPAPQAGGPPALLTPADVTSAFSHETGLPRVLLEPSERLDLAATENWFSARVIGQEQAVRTIIDVLATVKAGLSRPGRPIASLFFIGPTGVGKTEMAKSWAEFLYHNRQRMIRIDMSEYADPLAADRLIGGVGGAGILTAKLPLQAFATADSNPQRGQGDTNPKRERGSGAGPSQTSSLTLRVTVRREPGTGPEGSVLELAESCQRMRRNLAALAESSPVVEVQNELYRLEKDRAEQEARLPGRCPTDCHDRLSAARPHRPPGRDRRPGTLPQLRPVAEDRRRPRARPAAALGRRPGRGYSRAGRGARRPPDERVFRIVRVEIPADR